MCRKSLTAVLRLVGLCFPATDSWGNSRFPLYDKIKCKEVFKTKEKDTMCRQGMDKNEVRQRGAVSWIYDRRVAPAAQMQGFRPLRSQPPEILVVRTFRIHSE